MPSDAKVNALRVLTRERSRWIVKDGNHSAFWRPFFHETLRPWSAKQTSSIRHSLVSSWALKSGKVFLVHSVDSSSNERKSGESNSVGVLESSSRRRAAWRMDRNMSSLVTAGS